MPTADRRRSHGRFVRRRWTHCPRHPERAQTKTPGAPPLKQQTEWNSTLAAATVEWTHSDITGVDESDLFRLGQQEQVIGGLYTVRGYPESVVAGDTVLIGTVESRFHLRRALEIQPTLGELFGQPFRYSPQNVLDELATQDVHAGSNRFHIVDTLLY